MKVCFLLQRRFAYIGHEIARILKEKHGVSEFCGYVETRASMHFLQTQKDISYTQLVLDEEIVARYKNEKLDLAYLEHLKNAYGVPNLWPYILQDRVIRYGQMVRAYPHDTSHYTHEEMMRILQVTARAIEKFLDEEKPNTIFISVVSALDSYLLYAIGKKKGIQTLCLYNPRLGERYALTEDYFQYDTLVSAIRDAREHPDTNAQHLKEARAHLKDFQERPQYYLHTSKSADAFIHTPIARRNHFKFLLSLPSLFRSVVWLAQSHIAHFTDPAKSDYTTVKPWNEVWDKFVRKIRVLRGYRDIYEKPKDEEYAFFALQNEPEGLPTLLSPFYSSDQAWVVKQVARSLPLHFKLYVKDHPVMVGLRTRKFYQELKKIPSVKIIDPAYSGLALIQKAQLVVTITGTAGMEAAFLQKPAIVFSPVFYGSLPNVTHCRSIEELPHLIETALNNPLYEESRTIQFIAALLKESVELDLAHIWQQEGGKLTEEDKVTLVTFADLLMKRMITV